MAELIQDKLYQVAIGSRWNFQFVHAKDDEELIRYLVEHYPNKRDIYGACEFRKDGTSHPIKVISHPLFQELYSQKESTEQVKLPAGITIINNRPWAVMLPTGGVNRDSLCQWDDFISATRGKNNLNHCFNMVSWCQEKLPESDDHYVQRGYATLDKWLSHEASSVRSANAGYRPVLVPLDPDSFEPRPSVFLGREDGDIFRMGTIYIDDNPLINPQDPTPTGDIPDYIPGANLQIAESSENPKEWITWVKVGDVLISDRNLLKNISYDDLDNMGLTRGPIHLQTKKPSIDSILENAQKRIPPAKNISAFNRMPLSK